MLLMMLPILFLYEGSILLAALLDRRAARAARPRGRGSRRLPTPSLHPSTPTTDALRPQRLRPPPRGQDRVHHARLPHGRRSRCCSGSAAAARSRAAWSTRSREGGGGDDGSDRLREQEQAATAKARANPTDAALWAAVARARFNLANSGENVDQNTGNYTDAGAAQLRAAGRAWEEHLKLAKKQAGLARREPDGPGVRRRSASSTRRRAAQEIIAEDRDSAGAYATLAPLAYQAGQLRKGDLARDKALELTDAGHARVAQGQLEGCRAQAPPAGPDGRRPTATPTPDADEG